MSDMRLTSSETKMKINLCIFLLCNTAVSVFSEPLELNGIVGESVNFPAAVKIDGFLIYSGVAIGAVTGGSFTALRNEKFSGRLRWDSSTGLFSLSGLEMEDIGEYKVQNTHPNIITLFQLNVSIPVLKPHVSITHNEYPCTIECTAERGTGVTLSWYREGEKKPYVSSRVESAPHLYLPAPVERSGTYTCEAKNSVSNEKASITVGDRCTAERELNGIVGKSIEFPAAVKIDGFLIYSGVAIGSVTSGRFTAARSEKFNGRLQWDSSTGLFSLSGLRLEESGVYTVQDTQQNINTVFQLNVYKDIVNVSKPHLSVTRNEYRCTVLCAAARGTGVTLTLYKNGETNPYVTSPVRSHPHLDMTQSVESGTYTCEAKNSVSRETSDPLTVRAHCTGGAAGIWQAEGSKMWSLCLVLIVMLYSRLV